MKIIFTSFIVLRSGTYFTAYNDIPKIILFMRYHNIFSLWSLLHFSYY